ncbi:MAG: hypothetical protein IJN32_01765, partial [Thermoguttaceae bacterium]|nr:hypothetical protein [Thermoguttaceae bacterium]
GRASRGGRKGLRSLDERRERSYFKERGKRRKIGGSRRLGEMKREGKTANVGGWETAPVRRFASLEYIKT